MLPLLLVNVCVLLAVVVPVFEVYPAPFVSWLLLVIEQFNVTLPELPPPVIPVPATTAVMSP